MSPIRKFFLKRYFLVMLVVFPLAFVISNFVLKLEPNSGRDNLIFYTMLGVGTYYFAWKPARKLRQAEKPPQSGNNP